jgi:hypothetical protein
MVDVQHDPPTLDYRPVASPARLTIQPLPDGVRILFPTPANPTPRHVLQGVASVFGECFMHFGVYIVGELFFSESA